MAFSALSLRQRGTCRLNSIPHVLGGSFRCPSLRNTESTVSAEAAGRHPLGWVAADIYI